MRKRFEQQKNLFVKNIEDVKINLKSRDELSKVLSALQYIYTNTKLNNKVFAILEKEIIPADKNNIGRLGMSLWEILVLATARLSLDTNYDRLENIANNNKTLRGILGCDNNLEIDDKGYKKFPLQTLKDNIKLLPEDTINEISQLVVDFSHNLYCEEEDLILNLKVDTYVLETYVHFPTDLNLLWDSARKCLDIIKTIHLKYEVNLGGWRKYKCYYKNLKRTLRRTSQACKTGSKSEVSKKNKIREAKKYLKYAKELNQKLDETIPTIQKASSINESLMLFITLVNIDYYKNMLEKHIDLVERRLINEETIPSHEKIYSIFESHTEWLQKGKQNKKVELGHKLLVVTDQFNFIVHSEVILKQSDCNLTIPVVDKLVEMYGNKISSISFDKGFYSKENKKHAISKVEKIIMPKKGKLNKEEYEEEHTKKFKNLRNAHSAIESNINQLTYNGLNRCPDKGLDSYRKYAALGVLSYNLHRLGTLLIKEKLSKEGNKKIIFHSMAA